MTKFQLIVTAIFIFFIVAGVTLFATYKSKDSNSTLPTIAVWGTFPASYVDKVVTELNQTRDTPLVLQYEEKSEADFDKDFIEALARGQGPDAILIAQDSIERHKDKIIPIPPNILTEREFRNTYIPQSELYLNESKEALALPFTVDPLVMYWNRDIFTDAGIAVPPKYWDEFDTIIPKLTKKDAKTNIQRSALAMGEFNNVNHARELLGALLMQAGNPVTLQGDATSGGSLEATIGDGQYSGSDSSEPAIVFFTQFADPRNKNYSWNRSLPLSKSWFLSGSLATYFGFASELFDLRAKNPNIDFDVVPFPQPRQAKNRVTYGTMYGFSIVRSTANPSNTFSILQIMTSSQALDILSKASFLPPVRRDMIATGSKDPYQTIFFDSALISRSWLDKDPRKTSQIFQTMVESITSGRAELHEAIQKAQDQLDLSLKKQ